MMDKTNGLKALALLIALTLWAYVRVTVGGGSRNSITQMQLQIPLEIRGESSKFVPYEKSTDTITVTLRGDSGVVEELREGLVRAYVDLEGMAPGSNWPEVQVLAPPEVQKIKIEPKSVNVRISPLMVKEVPLKIETAGAVKQGFKIGIPIFEPKSVKLDGPEELVRQVAEVAGVVPVDGFDQTVALVVSHLNPVNDNGSTVLGSDGSLRLDVKEIRVTIPIQEEKVLTSLPILTENVIVAKEPGYRYTLEVLPNFTQVTSSLGLKSLPKGLQAKAVNLSPQGSAVEEVLVDILPVEGLEFVGATKVTLKLTPEKIEKNDEEKSE